ncbi:NAD-dependent epimerase/dehydratase family protein [Flavobacterium sp. MMLR14_040]|uniref:NAD-dependent epimerase/dehydratase family protein n=1 Tax=Flavobacterium sp. MMLR14_040 TaxID=3093843 RepID=UPI00298FCC86|nr:NAD-dependent epimerase/dehydratase family protein [Flavobacterium sp. MMLR14_040]
MQAKETILLLGGTGFIGRNIIDYVLIQKDFNNYKIIVLSRDIQKNFGERVEFVTGNYENKDVLISLFSKYSFTKVFHCATSTTPLSSSNNVLYDINGNLIATIGLLDVMKEFGCNFILYLSSGGAVYGEKHLDLISENEICNPVSSYGVVKLTIENYLRLYKKQQGINYLILRVSNPFGKFHSSENQGIVNIAIRRSLVGKDLEVWGDGTQSKDYIFIDDLVVIIFQLLKRNIVNKTINVGSGKSNQLNRILDIIKIYLPALKVTYLASKATDVKDFCLDISLLQSILDFEFTVFEEAIKKTILFEKKQLK